MAKGNILKEAIADAKAVREVALANAKAALEEAFTPKLQNMLSAKLSEDLDEDMYYDEDDQNIELGETDGLYDEDEKDMDEEIDLEDILNELELEEGEEADEEVVDEAKKADDDDEEVDLEEMKVGQPNYKVTDTIDVLAKASDVNDGLNEEFNLDSLLEEINNLEEQDIPSPNPVTPTVKPVRNKPNKVSGTGR